MPTSAHLPSYTADTETSGMPGFFQLLTPSRQGIQIQIWVPESLLTGLPQLPEGGENSGH